MTRHRNAGWLGALCLTATLAGGALAAEPLPPVPIATSAPPPATPPAMLPPPRPAEMPVPAPTCPPMGEPSVHAARAVVSPTEKLLPIDLPYALRLANADNPTIALARARVEEAYAAQRQAEILWVPNLWLGGNPNAPAFLPTFYHHDGFIQNANGNVFFTDKNNFFLQAGTSLEVSLADAVFAPRFARQVTAATQARAQVVNNDIQLDVALAYLDLLRAYGALAINDEAIRKAVEMDRAAENAFKRGLGKTGADPNRARTELQVRRQERLVLQEQAALASARLAELLLLDPTADLLPADQTVLPIRLVATDGPLDNLVAVALVNRPELAEYRALINAALAQWDKAKYRPLLPTLQAFYSGGSFMGGNPTITTSGGRDDVLVQVSWEFKNLGLGDLFAAREMRSRYNQANLRLAAEQARVAAEVSAAGKVVRQREAALREAQEAVKNAEEMWRKLSAIAFGVGGPARQYDPLEPFLAERALLEARTLYLDHVIEYNRNQFRLYWAMGQPPECAGPGTTQPVSVPVMPGPAAIGAR
jgi:outer membrane protein TolC